MKSCSLGEKNTAIFHQFIPDGLKQPTDWCFLFQLLFCFHKRRLYVNGNTTTLFLNFTWVSSSLQRNRFVSFFSRNVSNRIMRSHVYTADSKEMESVLCLSWLFNECESRLFTLHSPISEQWKNVNNTKVITQFLFCKMPFVAFISTLPSVWWRECFL